MHSLGNNVTDVIAALNCTYMAERTACEWVEALTLKKDLHVRLAIGRTERKSEKREEDFKTVEECLQHCWKNQIRPRKTGPLPSILPHTNALTVQAL